jgi:hypothetical protein
MRPTSTAASAESILVASTTSLEPGCRTTTNPDWSASQVC